MYIKHSKPVFTERDMWNLDNTLSQIIHSSLVKFGLTKAHPLTQDSITDVGQAIGLTLQMHSAVSVILKQSFFLNTSKVKL